MVAQRSAHNVVEVPTCLSWRAGVSAETPLADGLGEIRNQHYVDKRFSHSQSSIPVKWLILCLLIYYNSLFTVYREENLKIFLGTAGECTNMFVPPATRSELDLGEFAVSNTLAKSP